MIKISVQQEPYADSETTFRCYNMQTEIEICDDATSSQAIEAFIEALKLEGYHINSINNGLKQCFQNIEESLQERLI